jgi:alkylation response protein AidB-like acyl-CoA dehydrogenase
MALFHTEEQVMLADTVRAFLSEAAPVRHLRALRDADDAKGFSPRLWKQCAELGLSGILIDPAYGGQGLGHVEAGIVLEAMGRNLTPSPFLMTGVGAAAALAHASEAQRAQWLPQIASGDVVAALAVDEAPRHRPGHIALRAERSADGFRLSGAKRFVLHGRAADIIIVAARTAGGVDDTEGVTLFLVETGQGGVAVESDRLVDSSIAARLAFDGAELPASAVIGDVDGGAPLLRAILGAVRLGAAAELNGVGGAAMDMTLDYLKQRKQFGRVIASFQALQHRAARLYGEMEAARAAVIKAQHLLDAGDAQAEQAVMVAKAAAGNASALAVQEGVQMHGGIGMTDEYDIGLFMKRQRVLAELFGDSDFHADQLALLSGY